MTAADPTWRTIADFTDAEKQAMVTQVYEWGLDGWRVYEGKVDWDAVLSDLETDGIDLGGTHDDPFLKLLRREYNKGRKDGSE